MQYHIVHPRCYRQTANTMSNPNEEPPINCLDLGDGKMRCLWRDGSNQEHALYYDNEKEYIFFNKTNRHWIALFRTNHDLASRAVGRSRVRSFSTLDASRQNIYVVKGSPDVRYCVPPQTLPDKYKDQRIYSQARGDDNVIYVSLLKDRPPDPTKA